MKYGDPEYKRRLEVIQMIPSEMTIPSNKIDAVDLSGLSAEDMLDYEKRHLQELTDMVLKMDDAEQEAVARGLKIAVLHNAVGDYIKRQELKERKHEEASEI